MAFLLNIGTSPRCAFSGFEMVNANIQQLNAVMHMKTPGSCRLEVTLTKHNQSIAEYSLEAQKLERFAWRPESKVQWASILSPVLLLISLCIARLRVVLQDLHTIRLTHLKTQFERCLNMLIRVLHVISGYADLMDALGLTRLANSRMRTPDSLQY